MATNAAANIAQKIMGEVPVSVQNQDKQNKSDTTNMLACCWEGKEKLEMKLVPKPEISDEEDVIIKVTGSTGNKNKKKIITTTTNERLYPKKSMWI